LHALFRCGVVSVRILAVATVEGLWSELKMIERFVSFFVSSYELNVFPAARHPLENRTDRTKEHANHRSNDLWPIWGIEGKTLVITGRRYPFTTRTPWRDPENRAEIEWVGNTRSSVAWALRSHL
jgi:hypothetical protein